MNQPKEAAAAAEQSVEVARKVGSPLILAGALVEAGRAYRDLGRKADAELALRESVKWMELQRSEMSGGQASGASFLDGRESQYSSLMDLRAAAGDALAAIQISEQVRARWLLDAMAQGKVDPQQPLTAQEKERERALAHEAARWNAQLSQRILPAEPRRRSRKPRATWIPTGPIYTLRMRT